MGLKLPFYPWISPHRHTLTWWVFLGIRKRCAHWSAGQMLIKLGLAKSGAFLCVSLPPGRSSSGVPASWSHRVPGPTIGKASSLDETKPPAGLQQWSPRWVHRVSIFQTIHLDLGGLAFLLRPQRQLTCLPIFLQIYSYGKPTLDQKHYILKAVITHKYYHSNTAWARPFS